MSTHRIDLIDFIADPDTRPAVHRDELPMCLGNCCQGHHFCPHPLACSGIEQPRQQAKRVDVPLKPERVQIDAPARREPPASMHPISTAGHNAVDRVGLALLAIFALLALARWLDNRGWLALAIGWLQ